MTEGKYRWKTVTDNYGTRTHFIVRARCSQHQWSLSRLETEPRPEGTNLPAIVDILWGLLISLYVRSNYYSFSYCCPNIVSFEWLNCFFVCLLQVSGWGTLTCWISTWTIWWWMRTSIAQWRAWVLTSAEALWTISLKLVVLWPEAYSSLSLMEAVVRRYGWSSNCFCLIWGGIYTSTDILNWNYWVIECWLRVILSTKLFD